MTINDKEYARIKIFVKYIMGDKGGFPSEGKLNKDGTFTLFRHTYLKLANILQAEKFEDLDEDNKRAIKKQGEMFETKQHSI